MIKVFADGIDSASAERDILQAAQARHAHARLSIDALDSGRMPSPDSFRNNSDFLACFLDSMQDSAFVDISDFEIVERRQRWSRPLITIKKAIWKLLRFYTYRLWSQQNDVNGFMLAALHGLDEASKERQQELELRIEALEQALSTLTSPAGSTQTTHEQNP